MPHIKIHVPACLWKNYWWNNFQLLQITSCCLQKGMFAPYTQRKCTNRIRSMLVIFVQKMHFFKFKNYWLGMKQTVRYTDDIRSSLLSYIELSIWNTILKTRLKIPSCHFRRKAEALCCGSGKTWDHLPPRKQLRVASTTTSQFCPPFAPSSFTMINLWSKKKTTYRASSTKPFLFNLSSRARKKTSGCMGRFCIQISF